MVLGPIIAILWFIFVIWCIVDVVKSSKDTGGKILWVIVCFIPIIGVLIYYFAGREKAKKKK